MLAAILSVIVARDDELYLITYAGQS